MSYHDKKLTVRGRTAEGARKRHPYVRAVLRGINDITLYPPRPVICFGSLEDDWRAVGRDMRNAMSHLSSGE